MPTRGVWPDPHPFSPTWAAPNWLSLREQEVVGQGGQTGGADRPVGPEMGRHWGATVPPQALLHLRPRPPVCMAAPHSSKLKSRNAAMNRGNEQGFGHPGDKREVHP